MPAEIISISALWVTLLVTFSNGSHHHVVASCSGLPLLELFQALSEKFSLECTMVRAIRLSPAYPSITTLEGGVSSAINLLVSEKI